MGTFEEQLRQCEKIVELSLTETLLAKLLVKKAKIKWWMMGLYLIEVAYPNELIKPLWCMQRLFRRRYEQLKRENTKCDTAIELIAMLQSNSAFEAKRLRKTQNTEAWLNLTKEMSQSASQD